MGEALRPEEAREVRLPLSLVKRLRKLGELGAGFNLQQVGSSPLPQYPTRGSLVRAVEAHKHATEISAAISEIEDRSK